MEPTHAFLRVSFNPFVIKKRQEEGGKEEGRKERGRRRGRGGERRRNNLQTMNKSERDRTHHRRLPSPSPALTPLCGLQPGPSPVSEMTQGYRLRGIV